jgi:REP element-mobilizing transposase RayT
VNRIFLFCVAYAAQRFEIRLHAFCVLSNHYHLVATDTRGNLPEFMHWLNEYVAKCVNAKLGRWESFWSPGSYSAVRLGDAEDLLAKMLYVYLNPVEAGLVRKAKDWPGAKSLPSAMDALPVSIERPAGFFRAMGPVPRRVALRVVLPEGLSEQHVRWLQERVAEGERERTARSSERGQRFLGRRQVLRQSPFSHPRRGEPRRRLSPRVAARDKWRRIELLQRLSMFVAAYRDARRRFLDGERDVEFPTGTYWMRLRCGVLCAGP